MKRPAGPQRRATALADASSRRRTRSADRPPIHRPVGWRRIAGADLGFRRGQITQDQARQERQQHEDGHPTGRQRSIDKHRVPEDRYLAEVPQRTYFIVRFDSSGDSGYDRVLEIYQGQGRFTCLLEKAFHGSTDPGEVVGDRRARRPNERGVTCRLPRTWFPRIHRMVRFYAISWGTRVGSGARPLALSLAVVRSRSRSVEVAGGRARLARTRVGTTQSGSGASR